MQRIQWGSIFKVCRNRVQERIDTLGDITAAGDGFDHEAGAICGVTAEEYIAGIFRMLRLQEAHGKRRN